jgi:hypothetical protein
MKYYKTKKGRENFFTSNKGSVELLSEIMKVEQAQLIEFLSTDEKFFKRWNSLYNRMIEGLKSHKKRLVTSLSE